MKVPYCKLAVLLQSKTGSQTSAALLLLMQANNKAVFARLQTCVICLFCFFYIVSHNASVWVAGMRLLYFLAWWITLMTSNPCLESCQLCSRCPASRLLFLVEVSVLMRMCSQCRNIGAAAVQKTVIAYVSAELQLSFYIIMLLLDVCGKDVTAAEQ